MGYTNTVERPRQGNEMVIRLAEETRRLSASARRFRAVAKGKSGIVGRLAMKGVFFMTLWIILIVNLVLASVTLWRWVWQVMK
jgi:hypothetical protein